MQARLIHVLNQLQDANEKCRRQLLDGNSPGLVTMGRSISDLGLTLMIIAADNTGDQGQAAAPFDPRSTIAAQHLDR